MSIIGDPASLLTALDPPAFLRAGVLCAQTDPDAFFPDKGASTAAAKRICGACPVRAACLDYALEHGERHGVWGGLSPNQRHRLTTTTEEAA